MNDDITRVLSGLYIAITAAMPEGCAELADDILLKFSEHPKVRPEDQRIYCLIALCASAPLDEVLNGGAPPHPHLSVIQGGNSAA